MIERNIRFLQQAKTASGSGVRLVFTSYPSSPEREPLVAFRAALTMSY
jgi:hypothetical protein